VTTGVAREQTATVVARSSRLWPHVLALLLALTSLTPVIGLDAQFSADEGAVLAQADALVNGGGWLAEHPFPEADPELEWYPLDRASRVGDRFAAYAKLPLYAAIVAGLYALGGMAAVVGLSIVSTVAAAWGAAAIARRLEPVLAVPVLWVVGLGSPLLFDAYLVMAHALAAGCVAVAAVSLLRWYEERAASWLPLAGVGVVVAVGTRQEALLLAMAASAVLGWRWVRERSTCDAMAAATVAGAAVLGFLANRLWVRAILGTANVAIPATGSAGGGIAGRIPGLTRTWFGFGGESLLFVALALVVGAAFAARWPHSQRWAAVLASAAAVLSCLDVVSGEHTLVTGLLVAFPVLAAGLVTLRREDLTGLAGTLLWISGLFAAAVIATQYERGGTGEWGGRYFAIGLVLVVPVALRALWRALRDLPIDLRRITVGALAVCTVAVSIAALAALRGSHQRAADLTRGVVSVAARTSSGDGGLPVVISTERLMPRLSWRELDEGRWLLIERDELALALNRVGSLGVRAVTVATYLPEGEEPVAVEGWEVAETVRPVAGYPWCVIVYQRSQEQTFDG
jgi:hypothetical protein